MYTHDHTFVGIREKLCFAQTIYYLRHNYIIVSTDAPFYQIWLFLCTFSCFYLIFILHFTHILYIYTHLTRKRKIFILNSLLFLLWDDIRWKFYTDWMAVDVKSMDEVNPPLYLSIQTYAELGRYIWKMRAHEICVCFPRRFFAHKHTHTKIWRDTYMCKVNRDRVHLQSFNVWGCLC